MAWKVEFLPAAARQFDKLDKPVQRRIRNFLKELEAAENPRLLLEPYSGPLAGYWKKRLGDYRLICDIQDGKLLVLLLKIGHRREVYR